MNLKTFPNFPFFLFNNSIKSLPFNQSFFSMEYFVRILYLGVKVTFLINLYSKAINDLQRIGALMK